MHPKVIEEDKVTTIGPQSFLPLSWVVILLIFTATSATTVAGLLFTINTRLARMEAHMNVDWMLQDQKVWAGELQLANPSIKVPKVELQSKQVN